jgi:hypothetical protein
MRWEGFLLAANERQIAHVVAWWVGKGMTLTVVAVAVAPPKAWRGRRDQFTPPARPPHKVDG